MSVQPRPPMPPSTTLARTGIAGLDDVLGGGLLRRRLYLIQGDPGVGKTTVALQFLLEGDRAGETSLYVTLSESPEELHAVARAHGWSLGGKIAIYEIATAEGNQALEENTLYVPAEVELGARMRALLSEFERVKPSRVIIDSCSELRLLAQTQLRFRRQIVALKEALTRLDCTVIVLDNPLVKGGDILLQSLVHGVIELEQLAPLYGAERRRLRVVKLREVRYRGGYHDFRIETGGLAVYPRLVAAEHRRDFDGKKLSSGLKGLDALLGGGLDRGTGTLMMGPAGSGKSSLATRYAFAAASQGEKVAMFLFDEGMETLLNRSKALGMDLAAHISKGFIAIQQIDPAELSQGQFAHLVRSAVEESRARMVVIDSLNGYLHAMSQEEMVVIQLHEVLSYLRQQGAITVMVVAQHGLVGQAMGTPVDLSYLADTVVLTRYFEAGGRIHKAVSVVKKRSGHHEDTIREFTLGSEGITIGPPLERFRGVFTGVPVFDGPTLGAGGSMGKPSG